MKVEFFHDVICSFCFPMSYRMRKIHEKFEDIDIIHRSYALVWSPEHFVEMFGSREAAKDKILHHWEHANQNDERHRFNISGMKQESFHFPTSKNGLLAAKAAGIVSGQPGYWDVFDKVQEAFFMHHKNIELLEVLEACVASTSINLAQWKAQLNEPDTLKQVEEDLKLADKYGIRSVPALVINSNYLISGAQPIDVVIKSINSIREKEASVVNLNKINTSGDACHLNDGKLECD